MRKADYALLARTIRTRLRKHVSRCVREDIITQDASYFIARELIAVAEECARGMSVDPAAFLAACDVPTARERLRL